METLPDLVLWNIANQFTDLNSLLYFGSINKRMSVFINENKTELIESMFRRKFPDFFKGLARIKLKHAELNLSVLFKLLDSLPLKNQPAKHLKCTHDGSLFIKNGQDEATTFIILTHLIEYVKKILVDQLNLAPWFIYLCLDYVTLSINQRDTESIFMDGGEIHDELKIRMKKIQYEMRYQKIHRATKERLDTIILHLDKKLNNVYDF